MSMRLGSKGLALIKSYEVREWLDYEPKTGVFRWRRKPKRWSINVGDVAGFDQKTGHRAITIQGRSYYAHRLAWLWMTGEWPAGQIDHRDLNPANNRWENLREATHSQNNMNHRVRRDSATGLKGVVAHRGRFLARITADKRTRHLGTFRTAAEAHAAYRAAVETVHGQFGRAS